jgi:hypothetical protein
MISRNLDQDDPDAVRIFDPHLDQAPRLGHRFPHYRDSGRSQPGVLGVNVADLDPDHHRPSGQAGRVPGDLKQPLPEEEHQPGIVRRAELPVDAKAQQVTVEARLRSRSLGRSRIRLLRTSTPSFHHHAERHWRPGRTHAEPPF